MIIIVWHMQWEIIHNGIGLGEQVTRQFNKQKIG